MSSMIDGGAGASCNGITYNSETGYCLFLKDDNLLSTTTDNWDVYHVTDECEATDVPVETCNDFCLNYPLGSDIAFQGAEGYDEEELTVGGSTKMYPS